MAGTTGRLDTGVIIGPTPGIYNLDYMLFRDCYFSYCEEALIDIQSTTGQAKHELFESCGFNGAKYGIKQESGSFAVYDCAFGNIETVFSLFGPTDTLLLQNLDVESCGSLIESRGAGEFGWPVTISSGRFELDRLRSNGRWIDWLYGGCLTLQGCNFSNVYKPNFHIRVGSGGAGTDLLALGCTFPNDSPVEAIQNSRIKMMSNTGTSATGRPVLLQDQSYGVPGRRNLLQ